MKYVIACDVGGTRIKAGIVTTNGQLLDATEFPSRAFEGAKLLHQTLREYIKATLEKNDGECIGIGLGLTGPVDPNKGVVLLPGKFTDLEGFPIVPLLKEEFEIAVLAENDGRLAAYAEKHFGAAKNCDWAVIVTIGTGVGSGVIINGEVLTDPHLQAGLQVGHLIIDKSNDQYCLTGNYGTGEILCSATALTNQVRTSIQRGLPCVLTEQYFSDPFSIDFETIIKSCEEGDAVCLRELDKWIDNVAVMLINAVHAYGPEKIILSGGAILGADIFLDKLSEKVNSHIFRYPKSNKVKIVVSEIAAFAGVYGAAAYVMQQKKISHHVCVDKINVS